MFKYDENYQENEDKYKEIRKTILDEASDDDSSSGSSDSSDDENGKENDVDEEEAAVTESKSMPTSIPLTSVMILLSIAKQQTIIDQTETNLVTLRRTIYLTIQSSVGAEECAHKLLKMNLRPGQEVMLVADAQFVDERISLLDGIVSNDSG